MSYVKLFFADLDGQVRAMGGYTGKPISFILRIDLVDPGTPEVRLYAMADEGIEVHDCEVVPDGTTSDMWALAPDEDGSPGAYVAYGDKIDLGTVGYGIDKVYFWAKVKTVDEEPIKDVTVTLNVSGIAVAI
jgi:hypothetical protein